MKNPQTYKKISYSILSICMTLIMVISGFTPVMAASTDEIINSLEDIPDTLEDKDTQNLGSGKIYYRKADANIASKTPTDNYQTILNTAFKDDQYSINDTAGSIVDDWSYLAPDILTNTNSTDLVKNGILADNFYMKDFKTLSLYATSKTLSGSVGAVQSIKAYKMEGTDNSLSNAQRKSFTQMSKYLQSGTKISELSDLKDSTSQAPVYYTTSMLKGESVFSLNSSVYAAITTYFHNFKVSPIYPTINKGSYQQEVSDLAVDSQVYSAGFRNDSGVSLSGTQTLSNSTTYGAVNAVSGAKSYSYEESASVEYKKDLGVFGSIAGTVGFSATQAMEKGWSDEKSESKSKEVSSEAAMTLPPYTAAYIKQQQKKQTATTYYKCPVLISYDVTMVFYFGFNNNTSVYKMATFSGNDARSSLKERAILHPTDTDPNGINWNNLKKNDAITDKVINRLSQNVMMCTAGGSYVENLLTTESKVDELVPTRPLVKVRADYQNKSMNIGESFSLDRIKLQGLNHQDAIYYGFQSQKGTWKLTDEHGNLITDDAVKLRGNKGSQTVSSSKAGTFYLTYFIDEDVYSTIDNINQYATNQTVTRPTVTFTINQITDNNKLNNTSQVKNVTIQAVSNKIAPGKKITLTTNLPKGKVKWKSSNPKIATIDKNGVVKINKKAAGKKVVITASATDGSGKKKTFVIYVMKGVVKKITIKGKKSVKAGKTLKLKATIKASKGANKKLRWTTNNSKYATITSNGKLKTKKAGKNKTIKVTVTSTDGSNKKATIKIKMK